MHLLWVTLLLGLFFALPTYAQETEEVSNESVSVDDGGSDGEPTQVLPEVPDVFLPSLDAPSERPSVVPQKSSEGNEEEEQFWEQIGDIDVSTDSKRNSYLVGVGALYSNHGLSKALFKVSDDELLLGEAGEKTFGVFFLLDLGWRADGSEALRIRWGMARTALSIPDEIRSANAADSLEENLTLMSLDFNVKQNLDLSNDDMRFWWGAGLGLRYAFSSQTSGSGASRVSQLRHSSAIAPMVSLGADFPTNKAHYLFAQVDWLIFTGYQLSLGLSTRL